MRILPASIAWDAYNRFEEVPAVKKHMVNSKRVPRSRGIAIHSFGHAWSRSYGAAMRPTGNLAKEVGDVKC